MTGILEYLYCKSHRQYTYVQSWLSGKGLRNFWEWHRMRSSFYRVNGQKKLAIIDTAHLCAPHSTSNLYDSRSRGLQSAGQLNVKRRLSVQLFLFPWLLAMGVALQKAVGEAKRGNSADDLVAWRVSNEMFPPTATAAVELAKSLASLWAFL